MTNNNNRFVLDTNLLISGFLIKNSVPAKVFDYVLANGELLFSEKTFKEIEEVLFRPKFDRYLSFETRNNLIKNLLEVAVFVTPTKHYSICRDIKDNVFLDAAVAGKADFIVTGDEDLLVLKNIEAIPIISAKTLIKRVKN